MRQPFVDIPSKFQTARRWQWFAAIASGGFILTCFIGWPLGYFWPSIVGLAAFVPSVLLFSIKCHRCGWPAFTDFVAETKLGAAKWTFWGKDFGGIHLPLPKACTKCGAQFVEQSESQ
ncbi:hypothetical protein GRI89_04500 [Altererythrobacter salegens]|uniref:Uncharacterized protein n=1 Tax=Croceibacterium salegens TaxID=1737568 RepID=A0A6I4SUU7_9SPHN|nr:hypothetical protein [Croceibacterium salegens]MXO58800.1 hypothetical protein [Croceibacterium salegens]